MPHQAKLIVGTQGWFGILKATTVIYDMNGQHMRKYPTALIDADKACTKAYHPFMIKTPNETWKEANGRQRVPVKC